MKSPIPVAPVFVGPLNCEQVLSTPWRSLKAWCSEKKIPIGRIGRRPVVRLDLILQALDGGTVAREVDEDKIIELAARRKAGVR